ncbi:hypothetical protein ABBQ38_005793 [Trebouxia sp. C0009 RCD-2024]
MATCSPQHPCGSKVFETPAPVPVRDPTLLGSKRGRCSQEVDLAPRKACVWQEAPSLPACSSESLNSRRFVASDYKRAPSGRHQQLSQAGMTDQIGSTVGMERSLSEVSTLRAAATAAVAECTGGLGIVGASALSQQPRPVVGQNLAPSPPPLEGDTQAQSLGSVTHNTQGLSIHGDQRTAHEPPLDLSGQHQLAGYAQEALQACPPHGAKAICGRRPKMEDAYTAIPFLLEVPVPADQLCISELIPPRIATHVRTAANATDHDAPDTHHDTAPQASSPSMHHSQYMETLHFFGVFDGHGGAEAALHCAQTLHQRIAEALSAVSSPAAQEKIRESFARSQNEAAAQLGTSGIPPQPVQSHLNRTFSDARLQPLAKPKPARVDHSDSDEDSAVNEVLQEERRASQDREGQQKGSDGAQGASAPAEAQPSKEPQAKGEEDSDAPCNASKFQSALTNAFTKADEEFGKADNAALVGTTAVVALVGSRQLYVANCGDSRAVLSRGDVAIPLTDDHKAAREDETARVEAAGGQILFWNGVRVMGVLAVSRAIGDHCLRPFVIAQPEITILARKPDDELLLLASDGLWDVLTNQEACSLAKRCLRRARQRGATRQSAARIAATVLTRAAVDRGSRDNVTVVVVDLMSGPESEDLSRQPSSMVDGFDNYNDDNGSDSGLPGKSARSSETSGGEAAC